MHASGFKARPELFNTWPLDKQRQAYHKGLKTKWNNPNSIDIHSIQNITNIQAYLQKYITKNDQSKKPENTEETGKNKNIGRTWNASVILSNIKGATSPVDRETENQLLFIEKHFPELIFRSAYFTVIDISIEKLQKMKLNSLTTIFYEYLLSQFNYSIQLIL